MLNRDKIRDAVMAIAFNGYHSLYNGKIMNKLFDLCNPELSDRGFKSLVKDTVSLALDEPNNPDKDIQIVEC